MRINTKENWMTYIEERQEDNPETIMIMEDTNMR